MKTSKPITITPELAARYTNPGQFDKFDAAVRKILTVSPAELKRREHERSQEASTRPRRGPKPKNGASLGPGASPQV